MVLALASADETTHHCVFVGVQLCYSELATVPGMPNSLPSDDLTCSPSSEGLTL